MQRRTLIAAGCALALPGRAQPSSAIRERLPSPADLARVRGGGLVLYVRHGLTDNSRIDQPGITDFADCSTQRTLSPEGRRQAEQLGAAIRRAGWPVRRVISSPMCRSLDTARLAFGAQVETDPLLAYTAHLSAAQRQAALARTRDWLSQAVPAGELRVVVAHGPNLSDLTDYFPPEAATVLLRPLANGQFEYLGTLRIEQWESLPR
ncbi:histidine phosphatase family protein [Ideonella sp. 4Y16]|uniref:Histidine phosphatase family protein n=1 Tax=Ideonella alba TaxID=2824118 RepID=A0A940YB36_9BURK|nr:histidine phosphatase family protein [Ideonella alba]MBQ0930938.1 histidine phosphatase family protein [Ideonella alba]MBQ0942398.1 histidine phosphatase family protein [Ideonella alba]